MMRYDPEAFQNRPILFRIDTITVISIGRRSEDDHFDYKEVSRTSDTKLIPGGANLQSMAEFLTGLDEKEKNAHVMPTDDPRD